MSVSIYLKSLSSVELRLFGTLIFGNPLVSQRVVSQYGFSSVSIFQSFRI
jgi:hypothetical protein